MIFKILKILNDRYSNMVKIDFKPLEYIEVKEDKPLIIKLNEKYMFKCNLSNISNFIKFCGSKDIILDNIDRLNKMNDNSKVIGYSKILHFKLLINLLYEISKNTYKTRFGKFMYKRFLDKYLFDNLNVLFDIMEKLINHQTMLKKKQEFIRNIDIFNNVYSDLTIGGLPLKDLIKVDPITGEKSFIH